MNKLGSALPLWAQNHPESSQWLSLRQRQEEKDSFLPCCADKVNSAPYLRINRPMPTSRYVCVLHGSAVVYSVTGRLGSPPSRTGTSALAAHKHRTRTAWRAPGSSLAFNAEFARGAHRIALGRRSGCVCGKAQRPCLHVSTFLRHTPPQREQDPFLYKNILFKRQFKSKNSVQHHEFLFFLYQ